uniref:Galactosylgalactosylxylosylprotein 3-beta-glucuronosyltransferase n=1 Tax=Steinernema glaseri TaxID=37863 RepID=A0A1I7YZG9_9BILA
MLKKDWNKCGPVFRSGNISNSNSHGILAMHKWRYPIIRQIRRPQPLLRWIVFVLFVLVFTVIQVTVHRSHESYLISDTVPVVGLTQIIVITPTYRRSTRLPDLTRMANTLALVENIYWILVEDGNSKVPAVERLLNRTGIPHAYLAQKTKPGYPKRGWYQRDSALEFLRGNYSNEVVGNNKHSVVYFGDDDNSYDVRLFNNFIRNVKIAGVWAVGLVGGQLVEAPRVENDSVVGWDVVWNKARKFATDMAGFAVSLDVIKNSTAVFGTSCKRGGGAPETCFLEDLGLKLKDLEPFGFDVKPHHKKELVVWHTKTSQYKYDKKKQDLHGFEIE